MQVALLIGLNPPYVPTLPVSLENPAKVGDLIGIGETVYEVYKAEPVTEEGRVQNVYIQPKEEEKDNDSAKEDRV